MAKARYSKIILPSPGKYRSAAGSVVIADYVDNGQRTLVLERQQAAGKPRAVRKVTKATGTGAATAFPVEAT